MASRQEFPELLRRQRVQQQTPTPDGVGDFKEIINLFILETIGSYFCKFMTLVGRVKQQPDSIKNDDILSWSL